MPVLALIFSWCPRKNLSAAVKCRVPLPIGRKKKEKFFMTPQREEAERFVGCLTPYAVEFRYDDEAIHLISGEAAGRLIGSLLTWAEKEIASHQDSR
ncbi:hypothetical protein [Rhodoferax sp.]|uniref:hypothetical protein n=1 Tax=Rhodoferax sp. TaxID=50421 RepID=UPI003BAE8132